MKMGNAYKLPLLTLVATRTSKKKHYVFKFRGEREREIYTEKKERINRMKLFEPSQQKKKKQKKQKAYRDSICVHLIFSTKTFSCLLSSCYNMSCFLTLSFFFQTDYVKLVRLFEFSFICIQIDTIEIVWNSIHM